MTDSSYFGLFGLEDQQVSKVSNLTAVVKTKEEAASLNATNCCVCDSTQLKYRCPCCGFRTCGFDCVKQHKIQFDCNGKRDKIPFVKISQFTEEQFHDDYRFLEETVNTLDATARQHRQIAISAQELPNWLKKIQFEARLRGTRLKILPAGFVKRKANKTAFIYKEKAIHWDVEWLFKNIRCDGTDFLIHDRRVNENFSIETALNCHLKPVDPILELEKTRLMNAFQAKGAYSVILKTEDGYSRVDNLASSLRDILIGKTVIEFPIFIVTHSMEDFKQIASKEQARDEQPHSPRTVAVTVAEQEKTAISDANAKEESTTQVETIQPLSDTVAEEKPKSSNNNEHTEESKQDKSKTTMQDQAVESGDILSEPSVAELTTE